MTFLEYALIMNATKVYPASANVMYPALALSEEVGETVGILAKSLRDHPRAVEGESGAKYPRHGSFDLREEERLRIFDELGDVLWQWAALCTDLGFSLEQVAQRNIMKLHDRKGRGVLHGSGSER